jgi:hypothetical protein
MHSNFDAENRRSPGDVVTARKQLDAIIAVRNGWNTWTKRFAFDQLAWIRTLGVQWFKSEPEHAYIPSAELTKAQIRHGQDQGWQLRLMGAPIYFFLNTKNPQGSTQRYVLARPTGKLDVSDTFPAEISFGGEDSGGSPAYKTLQEFKDFWEASRQAMASYVVEASRLSYFVKDIKALELRTSQDVKAGGSLELIPRNLGGCREPGLDFVAQKASAKSYNELFCRKVEDGILVLPARIREPRLPEDLQRWLIQHFKIDTVGGPFADAFPQLDRVTKVYQELDISKVGHILSAELERAGQRIEFLGIHVPEAIIASWGMVILFAVQSYFWVQLRALHARLPATKQDEVLSAGWIAAYPDNWARLVCVMTVGVLPAIVSLFLVFGSGWAMWITIPLITLIIVLSLHSAFLVYRISRVSTLEAR